ncbi:MAG TPA: phage holin, LLH family [Thermomicrobiaceae bacterium]|nr:phage holin, LLH family [Thermomicrobiaceae bacterium]
MIEQQVLEALGSLALAAAISVAAFFVRLIRLHASVKRIELIEKLAGIAVRAIEQMSDAAGWSSKQKLMGALDGLRSLLKKQGISLTNEQMRTAIEDAVKVMKDANNDLLAPVPPIPPTPVTIQVAPPVAAPKPEPQPEQPPAAPKRTRKPKVSQTQAAADAH